MVFFKSHEIVIRRLRRVAGTTYASNFSATFTSGYMADIQPADIDRANLVDGRIGSVYECWVDSSVPVEEGDQIDSNGQRYSVKSVNYYRGAGLLDHKHLIMVATDANN